nr:AAA family ATPase [Halomonas sp.]
MPLGRAVQPAHTNELLVQIENFDGILLATTNRADSLDRAVMRRFDLKVEFLPLPPAAHGVCVGRASQAFRA